MPTLPNPMLIQTTCSGNSRERPQVKPLLCAVSHLEALRKTISLGSLYIVNASINEVLSHMSLVVGSGRTATQLFHL